MQDCGNHPNVGLTRRSFLTDFGLGVGGLAFASLYETSAQATTPLSVKTQQYPSKVKTVIQIFASGAPSQVDTFDYKPVLSENNEKKIPGYEGLALGSPFKFSKYGKSGLEISEVWSKTAQHADEMAIINSMFAEIPDHQIAAKMFNTGSAQLSKPSLGSWTLYGLGSGNENMPGFISLNSDKIWGQAAFLPGMYQSCNVNYRKGANVEQLITNIKSEFSTLDRQRHQLDLAKTMNEIHLSQLQKDIQLESRIQAFETAFKMQAEATDAFDLTKESQQTRALYGETEEGARLLLARRLAERGVRFVQVHMGGFDHHNDIKTNMARTAARYDTAISALLTDLKQRGLLESTLVIWGGEFGRTVTAGGGAGAPGRDHNGRAFSIWMAGGGIKGGTKYGSTDEFGGRVAENPVHIHDLHATILRTMGFDHTKLTFNYNGREFRLTDNFGNVIKDILT